MTPIIDTHCHVYPEKIAVKASENTAHFYGIPASYDGTVATLKMQAAQAGIAHAVINSVATAPKQVSAINRFIAGTVAESGGTMTGLGTLHPDSEDAESDVEQAIALGLKGIKLHPDIQHFSLDEPRVMRLFALCEGRLPMLLHLGDRRYDYSNPNRVKTVLEAFPRLRVIGAHFAGWSIWEEATHELSGYENLLVDCSSSMYALTPEKTVELIRIYGAERVLFGTDYPLMSPVTETERFLKLALTPDERERILWKNAAAFYGIEP